MNKIFEEKIDVFALTKEGTRKYYDNLYNKLINESKDIVDYQDLKAMSTGVLCPDCNSSHVIKNGLQHGVQNYLCKNCGRQLGLPLAPLCMAFITEVKCLNTSNVCLQE